MRNLIAAFLAWFPISLREWRKARTVRPTPAPVSLAPAADRAPAATARPAADDLRGEDVALVRPYVVAWERHVARELEEAWHRERRAADSLAAMGGAFLGVPA